MSGRTRPVSRRGALGALVGLGALGPRLAPGAAAPRRGKAMLRAGAAAVDISPRQLPVIISGSFLEKRASKVHDPLHARALVLDDGSVRVAVVIVDNLLMPRDLLDRAKAEASQKTNIPPERMLIAATHTHSAPCVVGALGTDPDPAYTRFLPGQLAEAIVRADANLAPAHVGWAVARHPEHTHCRRWILRPDRLRADPFGERTVRAHMHPGWSNPAFIGPAGPVDDAVSVLAVQAPDGRPLALLANYSMHYAGAPPVSADYFGVCARALEETLGTKDAEPPFVGILSQGTSGDLHWMDYSLPKRRPLNRRTIGQAAARAALQAYETIEFRDRAPLAMCETRLTLRRRVPDADRLAWAKAIVEKIQQRPPDQRAPRNLQEVYAREQIFLHEDPVRELKLQALRVGELGLTAIPCEVFGITGLKIKAHSPLQPTMNLELANGAEGYIPPPEQHHLGGYTTWPARSAGLEVQAEPKILEAVLQALEKVAGKPRRPGALALGPVRKAVLAAKPAAWWPLDEMQGIQARDASGHGRHGTYEPGIARALPGPPSPAFCGEGAAHRAAHFAGGRVSAAVKGLGETYSVELWFWNGLPTDARPVTGYLFSRGAQGPQGTPGDSLGLGGTHSAQGKLFHYNGDGRRESLEGRTPLPPETWHHVLLVREGARATVYLDGTPEPEIAGELVPGCGADCAQLFLGGRNDGFAPFEGRLCEVAVTPRALAADDAAQRCRAAAPGS